jgi:hypothetical protein
MTKIVCSKHRQPSVIRKMGYCEKCSFEVDILMDPDALSAIKQHIIKTGHRVTVETGSTNEFFLKEI